MELGFFVCGSCKKIPIKSQLLGKFVENNVWHVHVHVYRETRCLESRDTQGRVREMDLLMPAGTRRQRFPGWPWGHVRARS